MTRWKSRFCLKRVVLNVLRSCLCFLKVWQYPKNLVRQPCHWAEALGASTQLGCCKQRAKCVFISSHLTKQWRQDCVKLTDPVGLDVSGKTAAIWPVTYRDKRAYANHMAAALTRCCRHEAELEARTACSSSRGTRSSRSADDSPQPFFALQPLFSSFCICLLLPSVTVKHGCVRVFKNSAQENIKLRVAFTQPD